MTRKIIMLTGLAGSGKSTIAKALGQHGYQHMRFAGPLKKMLHALGLTWEELDGSQKEKPCELLGGKTPRLAMQTLGTEWGRLMIDQQLWTRAWKAAVLQCNDDIVVDDCRYPNEVNAGKEVGLVNVFRLTRVGAKAVGGIVGHSSEQELPFDHLVDNNLSVENTVRNIITLMETKE
jgi:hypothetical protein